MNIKRMVCALILTLILIHALPFTFLIKADASVYPALGSITECKYDSRTESLSVSGSIKHSVLVDNRSAKIGVYRFDPWNILSEIPAGTDPIAITDMSIRFEFSLPCKTIDQRMSLYAVAILNENGSATMISDPQYVSYQTCDTSGAGFKAVLTSDVAGAIASHAGSAIVDVYLDRLDNGNKSGYIFNADGELFYFDRDVVNEIDKKVLSYTASDCNVYFRFLISPYLTQLPFCSNEMTISENKGIFVGDTNALNAIYAFTYFLFSRYDGADFGKVNGIILGRGADMPAVYNSVYTSGESYNEIYARSLAIIGTAACEAAGDFRISLIVPITDTLKENRSVFAESFLGDVADYIQTHTDLKFTVMCESRHNPYKITDEMFSTDPTPPDSEIDGEEPDVEVSTDIPEISETTSSPDLTEPWQTTGQTDDVISALITTDEQQTEDVFTTGCNTLINTSGEAFDTSTEAKPQKPKPEINKDSDGYFCTDNIDTFTKMFNVYKKRYSSVNDGFAWCWYSDKDASERALSVCYSYNYFKLASIGADFYAVTFEKSVEDKFTGISHLFKYIDTEKNIAETEYARAAFVISDWKEIISEFKEGVGVFNVLHENTLDKNPEGFVGTLNYLDYSAGTGNGGWFEGYFCDSLGIKHDGYETLLLANMQLERSGVNHAEIGYILNRAEPLLLADALCFDIKCGGDVGALYEICISLYCDNATVVSRRVISGGEDALLSVDVSGFDRTAAVKSMKISLKRINGNGDCVIGLRGISIKSKTVTDADLAEDFDNVRDYLNAGADSNDGELIRKVFPAILILSAIGMLALVIASANDRKQKEKAYNVRN